jgi:hypothetical protein
MNSMEGQNPKPVNIQTQKDHDPVFRSWTKTPQSLETQTGLKGQIFDIAHLITSSAIYNSHAMNEAICSQMECWRGKAGVTGVGILTGRGSSTELRGEVVTVRFVAAEVGMGGRVPFWPFTCCGLWALLYKTPAMPLSSVIASSGPSNLGL